MIFITETCPSKSFSKKYGVFDKNSRNITGLSLFFRHVFRTMARIFNQNRHFWEFQNLGENYAEKNIYGNIYSDEISNCFPKEYARKSVFMDEFVKNLDFGLHFGFMMTNKYRRIKYIK